MTEYVDTDQGVEIVFDNLGSNPKYYDAKIRADMRRWKAGEPLMYVTTQPPSYDPNFEPPLHTRALREAKTIGSGILNDINDLYRSGQALGWGMTDVWGAGDVVQRDIMGALNPIDGQEGIDADMKWLDELQAEQPWDYMAGQMLGTILPVGKGAQAIAKVAPRLTKPVKWLFDKATQDPSAVKRTLATSVLGGGEAASESLVRDLMNWWYLGDEEPDALQDAGEAALFGGGLSGAIPAGKGIFDWITDPIQGFSKHRTDYEPEPGDLQAIWEERHIDTGYDPDKMYPPDQGIGAETMLSTNTTLRDTEHLQKTLGDNPYAAHGLEDVNEIFNRKLGQVDQGIEDTFDMMIKHNPDLVNPIVRGIDQHIGNIQKSDLYTTYEPLFKGDSGFNVRNVTDNINKLEDDFRAARTTHRQTTKEAKLDRDLALSRAEEDHVSKMTELTESNAYREAVDRFNDGVRAAKDDAAQLRAVRKQFDVEVNMIDNSYLKMLDESNSTFQRASRIDPNSPRFRDSKGNYDPVKYQTAVMNEINSGLMTGVQRSLDDLFKGQSFKSGETVNEWYWKNWNPEGKTVADLERYMADRNESLGFALHMEHINGPGSFSQPFSDIGMGTASGAASGAAFGPIGAGVGAVLGSVGGLLRAVSNDSKRLAEIKDSFGKANEATRRIFQEQVAHNEKIQNEIQKAIMERAERQRKFDVGKTNIETARTRAGERAEKKYEHTMEQSRNNVRNAWKNLNQYGDPKQIKADAERIDSMLQTFGFLEHLKKNALGGKYSPQVDSTYMPEATRRSSVPGMFNSLARYGHMVQNALRPGVDRANRATIRAMFNPHDTKGLFDAVVNANTTNPRGYMKWPTTIGSQMNVANIWDQNRQEYPARRRVRALRSR